MKPNPQHTYETENPLNFAQKITKKLIFQSCNQHPQYMQLKFKNPKKNLQK
jgi:hypothetical protein